MRYLVDSNVLVRLFHIASPQHPEAVGALQKLRIAKARLCLVPQNIYEFWTVSSRPINVNGLGFPFARVQKEVADLKTTFDLLDETSTFFHEWEKLMNFHAIVGKNAHDTRLVAAMIVHGITHLLTFNTQDFQRFTNVTVLAPADVIAMPTP
jgi:predicted nucleic acid-binding protein